MKKVCFVFGLLLMGSGVFAQTFSFGGHLAMDFENVLPTFELGINFSNVDVLAGVSFWLYQNETSYNNYQTYNIDSKTGERWFKIFAGFAPKVPVTEKLTLSFPLFAKVQFRDDSLNYKNKQVYSQNALQKAEYFGYGLDFGIRVYCAMTKSWSVYGGAIMNVVYIADNKYTYWKDSPNQMYTRENNTMSWLTGGLAEMGARFTF